MKIKFPMAIMHITDWEVVNAALGDRIGMVLIGKLDMHRELGPTNGRRITTSRIKNVVGSLVWTESGSCYRLGDPSEEWLHHLTSRGREYSTDEPIPRIYVNNRG